MAEEKKTQPVQKFSAGAIQASVWENKGTKDKRDYTFFAVNIQRSYKDGDTWKRTDSFRRNDLPSVALVANQAYQWIVQNKHGEED